MREILFRGKRTDNGEWVEGDLVQIPYRQWCGIVPQTAHTEVHTIDPETLGQYTGMIDKNGRKIFDGDIVKMGLLCFDGVRYDIKFGMAITTACGDFSMATAETCLYFHKGAPKLSETLMTIPSC